MGGNWKMNGSTASINGIIDFLKQGPLSADSGKILLYTVPMVQVHGKDHLFILLV